jgi:branched-chain amino acid transport system permease protein
MDFLLQIMASGILTGTVYALMALAVVIIYKSSSIFNFAHGSIVAFSAFWLWSLLSQWKFPIYITIPIYIISLIGTGYLIQRLILQRLIGQPLMASIMATIALGEVFSGTVTLFWPGPGRTLPQVIPQKTLYLGNVAISFEGLFNFLICGGAFISFFAFFHKTRIGLAMRGTAEDHTLAQSEGIKVSMIFVISWVVSIFMAAVGGILMSALYGVNLDPLHGLGMKSLAVVILGGLESIQGAIVAGIIIGVAEAIGSGYIDPYVGGGFNEVTPFLIILAALIFKPYGLFGYKRIERL